MFIGHLKKLLHYCFDYRTIMAGNANLSCIHLIQLTCENIGYPISPTMPNGTGLETGTTLCLNILDSLFHLTSMSGACKHIECIGNKVRKITGLLCRFTDAETLLFNFILLQFIHTWSMLLWCGILNHRTHIYNCWRRHKIWMYSRMCTNYGTKAID